MLPETTNKIFSHRIINISFFAVSTSNQIWANATEMAWALDRRGKVLPAQDVLIAAHALKFGGAILTSDRHFYEIPGMRVYDPAEEFPEWGMD